MGKTQDEDIVHAYNLIHSVINDIAIFRENIEKDFHNIGLWMLAELVVS